MNRQRPFSGGEPPALEAGQERRHMVANRIEDTPTAIERAKRTMPWGPAIVGKPWRSNQWWLFTVDTAKLEAAPPMPSMLGGQR